MELSDDSFPPEDFGIVSGMLNVKWDRIAPYPFCMGGAGWERDIAWNTARELQADWVCGPFLVISGDDEVLAV